MGNSPEFQRSVIWLSSLQDFINQLKVSELFLIKFRQTSSNSRLFMTALYVLFFQHLNWSLRGLNKL